MYTEQIYFLYKQPRGGPYAGRTVYRSGRRAFTDNKTLEKVLHYLSPLRGGKGGGGVLYIYIIFFYVVVTREQLEYNGNGLTTTVFPGIPICAQSCVLIDIRLIALY